jgi:hypothetical protein
MITDYFVASGPQVRRPGRVPPGPACATDPAEAPLVYYVFPLVAGDALVSSM